MGQQCPQPPGPDSTTKTATATTTTNLRCPDGTQVLEGQECPGVSLPFWQKPPFWIALVLLAAIAAAAAAAIARARLIARTGELLGLKPSLDLAKGRFAASDMTLDGPTIGLRARLDLEETRGG